MNERMDETGFRYLWDFLPVIFQMSDSHACSEHVARTRFSSLYGDFIAFHSELHSEQLPEGRRAGRALHWSHRNKELGKSHCG